jgi:hypothetical protein
VKGVIIDFDTAVQQIKLPKPIKFSATENNAVDVELTKLLAKHVIQPATHSPGQFISNIFLREKRDGSHRVILNLRELNKDVQYHHFKMDTLKSALELVTENCHFCSVDFKDAFYSVRVNPRHRKYLRFLWNNNLYQFRCLVMGLSEAPRKFTKIIKVLLSELRKQGILIVAFIDDTLIVDDSAEHCQLATNIAVSDFDSKGITIHPAKSVLTPTQTIEYLGFLIDSVTMTVRPAASKCTRIAEAAKTALSADTLTVRELAELIGQLVAAAPGVEHATLYAKQLEIDKDRSLKANYGQYDSAATLSDMSRQHLRWWQYNATIAFKPLLYPQPTLVIKSDSSDYGWGAHCEGVSAGGAWGEQEAAHHINVKEMHAALLALMCFAKSRSNIHVRMKVDNTTTVFIR